MATAAAEWAGPEERAGRRSGGRVAGAWAAGLLLAGVSAVVGCRGADSDGITPVPQLLAFLPWLLAPTALGLLLAVLARWRIGMVWGVAVLGALAWYIEPYGRTSEPSGNPVAELRVMTSNVQFGREPARSSRRSGGRSPASCSWRSASTPAPARSRTPSKAGAVPIPTGRPSRAAAPKDP